MGPVRDSPFLYYGAKNRLAKKILKWLPYTRIYVEPFAGSGSVLFHRKPSPIEVLNDIDNRIVTFFRVLRDPARFQRLSHMLRWTPYSFDDFKRALVLRDDESIDDIKKAWAWFVSQNQGFSGCTKTQGSWSRSFLSRKGMGLRVSAWWSRIDRLEAFHRRLCRAYIDSRDAMECIRYWDSDETTFYCDPRYVKDTRVSRDAYKHEQDDEYHARLVECLLGVEGCVVVSGYDHEIYEPLEADGWQKVCFKTRCFSGNKGRSIDGETKEPPGRTEVLLVNRKAIEKLHEDGTEALLV